MPIIVLTLLLPSSAQGHDYTFFYTNGRWTRLALAPVEFGYTNQFPADTTSYDDRFRDAMAQWSGLGQDLQFAQRSGRYADFNPYVCPGTYAKNGVHYRAMDGVHNVIGEAVLCNVGGTEIWSVQIIFDSAETWYTGTGDAPSSDIDFWSVATHELGHGTGWYDHFNTSDPAGADCSDSSTQETMCAVYWLGTERQRTPHTHDVHTFSQPY